MKNLSEKDKKLIERYLEGKSVILKKEETFLEALKRQLFEENHGIILEPVVDSDSIMVLEDVSFSSIIWNERHMDRLFIPENFLENVDESELVLGILVDGRNSQYRLIDGHHRVKSILNDGGVSGRFLYIF